jgi:hypothetical protein
MSAHILDLLQKLRSLRKWVRGMDINPEEETSYTTQSGKVFLKYVEKEYCAKHRRLPVTKPDNIHNTNVISSAKASRSGQSSSDGYDLSSDEEE